MVLLFFSFCRLLLLLFLPSLYGLSQLSLDLQLDLVVEHLLSIKRGQGEYRSDQQLDALEGVEVSLVQPGYFVTAPGHDLSVLALQDLLVVCVHADSLVVRFYFKGGARFALPNEAVGLVLPTGGVVLLNKLPLAVRALSSPMRLEDQDNDGQTEIGN